MALSESGSSSLQRMMFTSLPMTNPTNTPPTAASAKILNPSATVAPSPIAAAIATR
ncbi:Uncharacterised protein [Mycobacteroides abscessus subsp. abscessus]|nr:Uncharacterised protein [Mycobacteroides abscessus subsp. abscessus]